MPHTPIDDGGRVHGYSDDQWNTLVSRAVGLLEDHARRNEVTSYSELNAALADSAGTKPFDFNKGNHERNSMGALLVAANDLTYNRINGMLSALVKYLNENDPGPGFYRLAKNRGYMAQDEDNLSFWASQLNVVFAHYRRPRKPCRPTEVDSPIAALVQARGSYPNHEDGYFYDEVLLEVQAVAERSGSIGKGDIGSLLLWKRLNLSTPWTRALNDMSDRDVRTITGLALALARDNGYSIPGSAKAAREALISLPGCRSGQAVASTILTACAPQRMSVYDDRAVAALEQLQCPPPGGYYSRYMSAVCSLADEVNKAHALNWCPRDVDKALFMIGGRLTAENPASDSDD
jgi:hypothetical protein